MHILLTAIGSMSANTVINSLKSIKGVKVIGCDIYDENWVPNSKDVDVFYQIPKATSNDFIQKLTSICVTEKIDFIIPLTDPEVDTLAKNIHLFSDLSCTICYPGELTVRNSRNKFNLTIFFNNSDIVKIIPTYEFEDLEKLNIPYPLFAKPKSGRSSEGIFKAISLEHIKILNIITSDYIFQPIIAGTVITVDYIRDIKGNDFSVARKELLRTVNGAGLTVEISINNKLKVLVSEIGKKLEIKGCVNIEFIENNGEYYLMDLNPRFSAGLGFSLLAGYDFTKQTINVFQNKEIDLNCNISEGIYAKKYIDLKMK